MMFSLTKRIFHTPVMIPAANAEQGAPFDAAGEMRLPANV
jgi:hypothetical protein